MEKMLSSFHISEDKNEIQSMIDECFAHTKSIDKLHKLGLTDEAIKANIIKLYDFVMDDVYCSNCPGFEECDKATPHVCTKTTYQDGIIFNELKPCKKLEKSILNQKAFIRHDFPLDWFNATLVKMDKTGPRLKATTKFISYMKDNEFSWLYLNGDNSTGKSYFAVALANAFIKEKKGTVAFINSKNAFGELNGLFYKQNDSFKDELFELATADLLIIDGFGEELKTDVIRDEILLNLLESRNQDKLMTIFTSKFKISEIIDLYNKSYYAKEKAIRIGKLIAKNTNGEIKLGSLPIYQ